MARLEYRLLDETKDYPVLYFYDNIDTGEVAARFACDKLIKDGLLYDRASCAVELSAYVIYVQQSGEAPSSGGEAHPAKGGVRIELRQGAGAPSPGLTIRTFDFTDRLDVLLHLQCDYHYWMGEEWLKTLAVLDEDRKVYVCYANPGM